MRTTFIKYLKIIILFIPLLINAEDSLKSALNAVNRRQLDLSEYGDYDKDDFLKYNLIDENDNLEFLSPVNYNLGRGNNNPESPLMDYWDDASPYYKSYDNSFSSPFRERVEKDKAARQRELLAQYYDLNDYEEMMQKIYNKYHEQPKIDDYAELSKRYYNNLGFGSVGMKKRSRYFQPDGPSESLYLLNYAPRDELFNRMEEEENKNLWNNYSRERKSKYRYAPLRKRFPISKRSSAATMKRSTKKTDPKVEKELNNIFNAKKKALDVTKKPVVKTSKEELPKNVPIEKPIQVKKKSINWSDYFGLDRRKKSENDLDDEWLIERYHKAIAMATKRSGGGGGSGSSNNKKLEESVIKINEMDEKIKNIEETIVDDALKYTGAHEDTVDPKEIQEVKSKVISRLAAAYNLEKIRNALKEYKKSLENQHADETINEEKRISVPRKQAINEDREKHVEEDNNIKCTDKQDCDEQNYKIPSEILEQVSYNKGGCPKIERACGEVSTIFGNYDQIFETACNMHQMCLLCSDNSWFSPTRQCNILFLSKADELCDGDEECQRVARQSVKYLLRVNRSLRSDLFGACNLECPDKKR